ncbi:hypothetical protein KIW84_015823 [Lathyrus oleraceus]|uniref:GOLD domain-containing protein n=1 Tax=Pisum sativum TaxID=3888 RepID=A0A9D5BS45_PEA|nr:hypothetical protein KIW84_015823 [Pisum sativum]
MEKNIASIIVSSALLFFLFFSTSDAIWITLPGPSGMKCVSEEIQNNVVVLADYLVIQADQSYHPTISVKVTSPYGNAFHHSENVTVGNFAFTTQESGSYLACFSVLHNPGGGEVQMNLDWKIGVAAKDWDSVARKDKIEGVELELKKLEGSVEAIHENLVYLKGRDEDSE